MSLIFILFTIIAPLYYLFFFVLLNYAFYTLNKYYKKIKYKEKETGKEIDIQEKYAPLVPNDSLNYFSFISIGIITFPIRIFIILFIFYCLKINLKILKLIYRSHESNENQRLKLEKATYFWMSLYFFVNNISTEKNEIEYKDIYKKYLGDNYDFNQNNFSVYISNHFGYLEIAAYMREYAVSYLVTYELLQTPAIGAAMAELGSFFVNRENEESRINCLKILSKRQNDFYNKKNFVKTLVFPEGTTTNGKYIASFKRGVFISLLPIKPLIVIHYEGFPCSTNRFYFFVRTVATFKIKIKYAELPVIKPTDYMFEKYKDLGKDKWEIYAKVVNKIYSEIGGFKETDIRFRDRVLYYQIAENGYYVDK